MAADDDEDEIRSGSNSPPPPGKFTVTVASTAPPSSSKQKDPDAVALGGAGGGRPSGGGGGREDCWSERATGVLIDTWGEKYLELSRGNLKQKHWEEVAETVRRSKEDNGKTRKTDVQCKNRIDTVKKKYKQEKARIAYGGGGRSGWVFYDKLDRLIGSTAKIASSPPRGLDKIPVGIPMGKSSNHYHQEGKGRVTVNVPMGMVKKRCSESQRWSLRKRNGSDSDSEFEAAMSEDSGDSLPPPPPPLSKRMKQGGGDKWRELSSVIMRFGEAYEQIENAKLKQVVEMEKERFRFLKELEMQRMQFFGKIQLELSKLKENREQ